MILIDDLELDMLSRRARRAGKPLDLTAKEFALLAILAQGQSRILSKGTIAELAWGIGFDSNTKVVETAINRLSVKIDGPGQNKLLHTVRGMGYALAHRPGERS
ncbi:winged helix-turn-helix domain-containing protein [Caulobacter sp. UC70_42]|uniref:winged helix-turn-helix domain-containing protein n=1 Tax=Caulobacter sp. UC70_42 TaxID=3374551 RepID=UPI003756A283